MTSSTHPTWYDVLGVSRDASPDEIKAAWRDATDKFEPGSGSGQFRMFNEAADVLLDPARRAAYDETLGGPQRQMISDETGHATPHAPPPVAPELEPAAPDSEPDTSGVEPAAAEAPDRRRWARSRPAASATDEPPASRRAGILLLVLGLLTVAAVVAAAVLGMQFRENARIADARDDAPAAAERAAKAILAYDYRRLPTDRKRASGYLTDDFEKEYLKNFTLLEKQKDGTPGAAVQTKAVVTASVVGSGVMDAEEGKVRVLVYVNQVSNKPGVDPQIFQNRVAMTMEQVGKRWLVDDLKSY